MPPKIRFSHLIYPALENQISRKTRSLRSQATRNCTSARQHKAVRPLWKSQTCERLRTIHNSKSHRAKRQRHSSSSKLSHSRKSCMIWTIKSSRTTLLRGSLIRCSSKTALNTWWKRQILSGRPRSHRCRTSWTISTGCRKTIPHKALKLFITMESNWRAILRKSVCPWNLERYLPLSKGGESYSRRWRSVSTPNYWARANWMTICRWLMCRLKRCISSCQT